MTGLDLGTDRLIEIAALVTDSDLNILGDGIDVIIHADDDRRCLGVVPGRDALCRFGCGCGHVSPRIGCWSGA